MLSEWTKVRFEDLLVEPVRNGIYKKKEFHGRGAKIVNMGELFRYSRLMDVEMKRVELTANEVPKVLLKTGDLLFARRSLTAEGAGKCSIVREVNEPTTFESSIIRARPNPELSDSDFLYYLYSSEIGYNLLDTIRRSVAVSGITGGDLKNLELDIPPLAEQKAIAHILGSLDDKIEFNRRMNATLEGMAQALFKSWFVDFDPVIDNTLAAGNPIPEELADRAEVRRAALADGTANREAAKPFPAGFQHTEELGWIPEGWKNGTLGVVAKAVGGYAFKSKVFQDSGFPVIKIKNLVGDGTISTDNAQCVGNEDAEEAIRYVLQDGDVLMAMTGATVGKIGIVVNGMKPAFLNQRVAKIASNDKNSLNSFLFCFFKDQTNFEYIVGAASGSAQPNISSSGIESVGLAVPPNEVLTTFSSLVDSHFQKWIFNYRLSTHLQGLRDILLPKLISGELRIPDAEKLAEEALA